MPPTRASVSRLNGRFAATKIDGSAEDFANQLPGAPGRRLCALVDDRDAVPQRLRLVRCSEWSGRPCGRLPHPEDLAVQVASGLRVERGCGFVEEHELRAVTKASASARPDAARPTACRRVHPPSPGGPKRSSSLSAGVFPL